MDARRLTERRRREARPRALWGVTPINILKTYALADQRCGIEAESLVFTTYYITSDFDVVLSAHQEAILASAPHCLVAFRWLVLAWVLLRYDVINLYNDRGVIEPAGGYGSPRFGIALAEMDLYRETGKTFFTHAYGADHRTRMKTLALGKWNFCVDCPEPGKFCLCDDAGGERVLREIAGRADRDAFDRPGHGPDSWRPQRLWSPVDPPNSCRKAAPRTDRSIAPLRVGHFPNHGFFKGTRHLEAAVDHLRREGVAIELVMISGRPHDEIIDAMREVDVLVDQLISGSFGLTAVEAMALATPVVCYLRDGVAIAEPNRCPIIKADPDTIADVLKRLATTERHTLADIGTESRAYVLRNYSVDAFARRLAELHLTQMSSSPLLAQRLRWRARRLARDVQIAERSWLRSPSATEATTRPPLGRRLADVRMRLGLARTLFPILVRELKRRAVENLRRRARVLDSARPPRLRKRAAQWISVVCAPIRSAAGIALAWVGDIIKAAILMLARRAAQRRTALGQLRSVWGFTPILTLPLLARCDRLLGLQSQSLVFVTYYVTRGFDINLMTADQMAAKLARKVWSPLHTLFRKAVLAYVLVRYDIVHSFYDRGVLLSPDRFGINRDELDVLSRLGKRLYTYAYGADVRARDLTLKLDSPNLCQECPEPGKFCICNSHELISSMQRLEGLVTAKIAMGDMAAYVPGCRNLHYWPVDMARFVFKPRPPLPGRPLRVAHAPNHPHFKGTRYLVEAIERLQREGHAIELVSVQGVPNQKVIELFEGCDVVADQFVAGFHGYTALEAMALGRPVLCFLRGPDMAIDPDTCPIINTRPQTVYAILKQCISGEIDLDKLGRRSRCYIERYYSLEAVAARLGRLYIETARLSPTAIARLTDRVRELEAGLPCIDHAAPHSVGRCRQLCAVAGSSNPIRGFELTKRMTIALRVAGLVKRWPALHAGLRPMVRRYYAARPSVARFVWQWRQRLQRPANRGSESPPAVVDTLRLHDVIDRADVRGIGKSACGREVVMLVVSDLRIDPQSRTGGPHTRWRRLYC